MEKKKAEENIEDGLQSQSLEEVDSCSSSILDSDEEDDGINVTIKAVEVNGSAEKSADPVSQKLAGAARRKFKKMVDDGIDAEEAHAQVLSSTPKRNRNAAMISPSGGAGKPVPKKVCETAISSNSAAPKVVVAQAAGQLGSKGSEIQEEGENDVAEQVRRILSDVINSATQEDKKNMEVDSVDDDDTGKAATGEDRVKDKVVAKQGGSGLAESTGSGGHGGKVEKKKHENQGGSASKKPRMEYLPAPTYEQIVSRVILGIIPAGYPEVELTPEQQEVVKDALLEKVLEQRREKFKPKFVYCKARAGYVLLSCQDSTTANWVKTAVSELVPWEEAILEALEEAHIPRKEVLLAFFYRSKKDDNDTIRGYLESQNDDLDTSAWKILHRTARNEHVKWAFTVDAASMQVLEDRQLVVNYKFGQTLFRKKRSDTGAHPVDDDLEMVEGMEFEEFPAVMEVDQPEGAPQTGSDAGQGKGCKAAPENEGMIDFAGKDNQKNPRATNAQGSDGTSSNKTNTLNTDLSGKETTQNPRANSAQGSVGTSSNKTNTLNTDLSGKGTTQNPRATSAQGFDGDYSKTKTKKVKKGKHQPIQRDLTNPQEGENSQQ